jgi:hypothetical protein
VIFERKDLESALTNAINYTLLGQQFIRIGDNRETRDGG